MGSLHDVRFPGEGDEYRDAHDELLRAMWAMFDRTPDGRGDNHPALDCD